MISAAVNVASGSKHQVVMVNTTQVSWELKCHSAIDLISEKLHSPVVLLLGKQLLVFIG
jgi:hypothetical protein